MKSLAAITVIRLATLAAAVTLAGCSTLSALNPFSSKTKAVNAPAPLVAIQSSLPVQTAWTANVGKTEGRALSPVLVGESVYAAGGDGDLTRVEASTGKVIWRVNTGTRITAGVGSDGLTVAVATEKGMLLAYDAEGKLRWKAQASSEVLSAPAVGQGLVVVRSIDNRIAAYDAETGTRRWIVQRPLPPLTLRSAPGIVIAGPTAFVGLPGGRLLALATTNGGPRWEVAVADPRGTTELERIADVSGMPVIAGREICAVAYQGRLACFDALTGAPRWAKELSSVVGPAIDDSQVIAADVNGNVLAFRREGGANAWRNDKLAFRGLSAPVVIGTAVAVGDAQGYVHFLSRDSGNFVARIAANSGSLNSAAPVSDGKRVIFQSQSGALVALAID